MLKKILTTLPAGLGALFLAACGDSPSPDPVLKTPPAYEETYHPPATTSYVEDDYEQDDEGLTEEQIRYLAALQRARMIQQYRQAQMQQYARQVVAAQMLRNAYAQQQGGGYYGSTGSYRRPGSAFSTYDHTGTSVYSDGNGVVGVMTPNGSWYPGQ